MAKDEPEILPPRSEDRELGPPRGGNGNNILQIGQLHYYGNDLAELRKLAEVSPKLAEKVVDQRDREDRRGHASYRFGLLATVGLLLGVVAAFTLIFIFAGVVATLVLIGVLLAIALLIRVILTGEWSDTSWFGKLVSGLAGALGSQPVTTEEPPEEGKE